MIRTNWRMRLGLRCVRGSQQKPQVELRQEESRRFASFFPSSAGATTVSRDGTVRAGLDSKEIHGSNSTSLGTSSPTAPLAPSGAAPPVGTGFYDVTSASNTRSSRVFGI